MGLRTASVRHTHVEVMAPALTETVQTQNFDLPPKSCLEPAFPINSYKKNKYLSETKQAYSKNISENFVQYLSGDEVKKLSVNLDSEHLLAHHLWVTKRIKWAFKRQN
ncbi:hypothetical protein JTB14_025112 [Gonioctena quinquepunctata]|nr:hypothetical protein JTB14_025112 [Gonioctena quinquepunctata]